MNVPKQILRITVDYERLDAAAAPDFKRYVDQAGAAGCPRVLLDLNKVAFVDSTALGVFVSMLKQMGPGGRIAVVGATPAVARLFEITRLDSLFRLCANENEAITILDG